MSATYNPIPEQFTDEELAFLLAFEANEKDKELVQKRENAYMSGDLGLATRLERITHHSQRRLYRRLAANNIVVEGATSWL